MATRDDYLALDDDALDRQCRMEAFRSSGPGGQHRNKTSSGVRLTHEPTGVTAQAAERRSQHENRSRAMKRLRMAMALELREPTWPIEQLPPVLRECLIATGTSDGPGRRLQIGRRDRRFWPVAAVVLDGLAGAEGKLADLAAAMGISTSNLVKFLKTDRHLLSAAQTIRREQNLGPIR
jgi:hypothetical protein